MGQLDLNTVIQIYLPCNLWLQGCIEFLIIFFSLGSKQLSDLHVKLIYKLVHFYEITE